MNEKQNVKSRPRVVWKDGKCIIYSPESKTATNVQRAPEAKAKGTQQAHKRRTPVKTVNRKATRAAEPDFFAGLKNNIVAVVLVFAAISVVVAAAVTFIPGETPAEKTQDTGIVENNIVNKTPEEPEPLYVVPQINTEFAVCIDPGHGFDDVGTSNPELGVYEHEVVLSVGLKLRDKLEAAGIKVYMTHDTNEPPPDAAEPYLFGMKKRNGLANSLSDVGLYISIHCDAFYEDTTVYGPRVYHMSDDKGGEGVAAEIEKELLLLNSEKEIQVKAMSGMNSYQVLRESDMPAVLVETGFLSNPGEGAAMLTETWRDDMAEALAKAIITSCENGVLY